MLTPKSIMRLTCLLNICLAATLSGTAQTAASDARGVHFETGLSWPQVLAKARAENKPIFVDCYATWCALCKEMDKTVYPDANVGDYLNEHFICVKVQMDTTKQDTDVVKGRQADAHSLEKDYKVRAYPTFLFFSPEGKALHKAVGGRSAQNFLALAQVALDPARQYYTLLNQYNTNKNYKLAPKVVQLIKDLDGDEAAKPVALDYIDHYLAGLSVGELMTDKTLNFLSEFRDAASSDTELGSAGTIFRKLYAELDKPEKTTPARQLAQAFVDNVIVGEEIDAKLYVRTGEGQRPAVDKPDEGAMQFAIGEKYNTKYAKRLVPLGMSVYYYNKKDYAMAVNAWLNYMGVDAEPETRGSAGDMDWVNSSIWVLAFEGCSDRALLEKTIPYARTNLERTASGTRLWCRRADTLANLLYKAGHSDEAISMETTVAEVLDKLAAGTSVMQEVRGNIEKMKHGLPTWESS